MDYNDKFDNFMDTLSEDYPVFYVLFSIILFFLFLVVSPILFVYGLGRDIFNLINRKNEK